MSTLSYPTLDSAPADSRDTSLPPSSDKNAFQLLLETSKLTVKTFEGDEESLTKCFSTVFFLQSVGDDIHNSVAAMANNGSPQVTSRVSKLLAAAHVDANDVANCTLPEQND